MGDGRPALLIGPLALPAPLLLLSLLVDGLRRLGARLRLLTAVPLAAVLLG